jgi:hypothetical protein
MNRKILCMTYKDHSVSPSINSEECAGDCYAYDDVLKIKGEGWTVSLLQRVMGRLIAMHAGICGNANYRLGIDLDEDRGLYVGTFLHFGALETTIGSTIGGTIENLSDIAGRYFDSEQYQRDLALDPGKGRDACAYGEDRALAGWMIGASGIDLGLLGGSVETAIGLLTQPELL